MNIERIKKYRYSWSIEEIFATKMAGFSILQYGEVNEFCISTTPNFE